jgi:hypothetical protein
MANPVVQFEVLGKDRESLKSFYTSLFGWTTQDSQSRLQSALRGLRRPALLNSAPGHAVQTEVWTATGDWDWG